MRWRRRRRKERGGKGERAKRPASSRRHFRFHASALSPQNFAHFCGVVAGTGLSLFASLPLVLLLAPLKSVTCHRLRLRRLRRASLVGMEAEIHSFCFSFMMLEPRKMQFPDRIILVSLFLRRFL